MGEPVGILAAACSLPSTKRTAGELFAEEGLVLTPEIERRLGVREIPICDGETASSLAVSAARKALQKAAVDPTKVDVVVEYSFLPQEYLVPVWNMGNKVQAEVGANKSFVVGFSGNGASNFMVALSSAIALLQENENLKTALLVAGDATIPGNRVLNPEDPVSILGDSGSALILQRGADRHVVMDTELLSDGANQDIYYIPGGSLENPNDIDLYRLQLDKPRYDAFPKASNLRQLTQRLLDRAAIRLSDIRSAVYTNISSDDQADFQHAFEGRMASACSTNVGLHGHLQGTDLVLNYLSLIESDQLRSGDYVLAASHGMGTMASATLIRC
jgi:3-oxoacyl-[acyl-carrier-protein] synthase-3